MGEIDALLNHGSTRKILSLAKELSDPKLESSICRTFTRRHDIPPKKVRNFNKHPRNMSDESLNCTSDDSSDSPVIYDRNKPHGYGRPEKATFQIHKNEAYDSDESDEETLYESKCVKNERVNSKTAKETENNSYIKATPGALENHFVVDSCDDCDCDVTIRKSPSDYLRERVKSREERRRTLKSCPVKRTTVRSNVVKKVVRRTEEPAEVAQEMCPGNCESSHIEQKFVMDKRVKTMIEKSLKALEDIRLLMEFGIPPPDGAEDFQRRKKRSFEFASRFSRIYVYQLNRQIKEIQNMLNPATGRNNRSNFFNLNQKMFSSHQIVFQGLQAYHSHLPTSIAMGVPDKLKELLMEACTLCNIYRSHSDASLYDQPNAGDIIDVFEIRCKSLLEKVEIISRISSKATLHMSNNNSKFSLLGYKGPPKESKSRFSMYHKVPIRKDVLWKKSIAALAQKKLDVPSRYKTATLAHRPPPVPVVAPAPFFKHIRQLQNAQKLVEKKPSSVTLKSRSIKSRLNDDNVETMVQVQDKRERSESEESHKNTENVNNLKRLAQQFFEKIFKENELMTQSQYECVLEHFINMVRDNKPTSPSLNKDNNKCVAESRAESIETKAQIMLEEKLGKPIEDMQFEEILQRLLVCAREAEEKRSLRESEHYSEQTVCERTEPYEPSETIEEVMVSRAEDVPQYIDKKIKRAKKQTVTVTGVKNAQLICIRDDNSIKESDIETITSPPKSLCKKNKSKGSTGSKRSIVNSSVSNECTTVGELVYKERRDLKSSTGSKVILNRLNTRNLRQLQMLPQEKAVNIIQYKLDFHKNSKDNYMYKNCKDKSLWLLMGRISDKLLEEAMTLVTRDIQVDEILQKIYANEFK